MKESKKKNDEQDEVQKEVFTYFEVFVDCGVAPRKDMIVEFLKTKGLSISWEKVKDMVWNEMKRRAKASKSKGEFQCLVVSKFQDEIATGWVPQEGACWDFLMLNDKNVTLPWQAVQSIIAGEISKKKRKEKIESTAWEKIQKVH